MTRWMKPVLSLAVAVLLAGGVLPACMNDDDKDTDQPSDGDTDNTDVTPDGDTDNTDVTPDGDETAAVSFPEAGKSVSLAAGEYRLIAAYTGETQGTTNFTAALSENGASSRLARMNPPAAARWQKRLALDALMHARGEALAKAGFAKAQGEWITARSPLRTRLDCSGNTIERGGSCVDSFTLKYDVSNPASDVEVVVKGVGSTIAVAVDKSDEANVSDDDVNAIITHFDSIIGPRDHALFGSPVIDGTDYADVDGNGKRLIVLTHLVKALGAVGFFNPNDFVKTGGNGNAADMLWVVTPDADNTLESVYGTVAHEYFHLIHYAIKATRYGHQEDVFLSESLAHLAEDATGFGIDNVDTAWSYLDQANKTTWAFSNDSVEARGMGYLFLRYLFEQQGGVSYSSSDGSTITDKGGAAFLKKVVDTDKLGFDAVGNGLGSAWKAAFPKWIAAVTAAGTSAATSAYGYKDLYDDPITGQKIGACTNCTRKNAAGQDVTFTGFATEDLTDNVDGTLDATGLNAMSLNLGAATNLATTAEDADVVFVLVKK